MLASSMISKNNKVILVEKNEKLGKKLYITGKGRCNVTNDCTPREFLENVVTNAKFMQSAIYGFTSEDTMAFLEENGLSLVVERGNRVFPKSNKSSDVIKTLSNALLKNGVEVRLNTVVESVKRREILFCRHKQRGYRVRRGRRCDGRRFLSADGQHRRRI